MSDAPLTAAVPPGASDMPVTSGPSERDVRRAIAVLRRLARNVYVPVRPTPKQAAFIVAPEREVLFTGSGGCGKTVGLLMAALADVDRPGYRALLVQRTLAGPVSLAERIREWLEGTDATWDSNARLWRFPSGASIDFGHERFLYTAGQYHAIFVDDLTLFADHEYAGSSRSGAAARARRRQCASASPPRPAGPATTGCASASPSTTLPRRCRSGGECCSHG